MRKYNISDLVRMLIGVTIMCWFQGLSYTDQMFWFSGLAFTISTYLYMVAFASGVRIKECKHKWLMRFTALVAGGLMYESRLCDVLYDSLGKPIYLISTIIIFLVASTLFITILVCTDKKEEE